MAEKKKAASPPRSSNPPGPAPVTNLNQLIDATMAEKGPATPHNAPEGDSMTTVNKTLSEVVETQTKIRALNALSKEEPKNQAADSAGVAL